MASTREVRKQQLYQKLTRAFKIVDFSPDLAEMIYSTIADNVTTTQINHILIDLNRLLEEYQRRPNAIK